MNRVASLAVMLLFPVLVSAAEKQAVIHTDHGEITVSPDWNPNAGGSK